MRRWTLALLFLLPGLACGQRRGGGGGGGDHDDDFDNGDNNDGGSNDSPGSDGGDTNFPKKPCGWNERQKTFGLPGIYYNGSIIVRHHVTGNTAWDDGEDVADGGCDNDDGAPKTYTYPALLLIAPTGNESDTNPMHWSLRAFQPADQVRSQGGGFIDISQRWVSVRSSDFIVRNETLLDPDNSAFWSLLDTWRDSDATKLNHETQVYWPTRITSQADGVYSARAEYDKTPPEMRKEDYRLGLRSYGKYSSQFVTLSDVCILNQVRMSAVDSPEDMPSSHIPEDGSSRMTTTPTVWLAKGATAELLGIGADSMTMTLNNSIAVAAPLSSGRKASCPDIDSDPFEMGHFGSVHSKADTSKPWTLTVSIEISFEGSIVRENSTTVDRVENEKLVFGTSYDDLLRQSGEIRDSSSEEDGASSQWGGHVWAGLLFCLLLGV